jgi:hypothetical protein
VVKPQLDKEIMAGLDLLLVAVHQEAVAAPALWVEMPVTCQGPALVALVLNIVFLAPQQLMQVVEVEAVLMRVKLPAVPAAEVGVDPSILFRLPVQLTQVAVEAVMAPATVAALAAPVLLLLDIQALSRQLSQPLVVQL